MWCWRWLGGGLLLGLSALTHADIRVVDDAGQAIRLIQPAQRIVSLTPHLTELVFAAGAGNQLVGVSAFSDFPSAARKLPVIGDFSKIDLERVAALKPDLILAWISGNPPGDIARLRTLGLNVLVVEESELDDIARHLLMIGELAGTPYAATRAASLYRKHIRDLQTRYRHRVPVTVFYEIWHQPMMTIGQTHLVSRAIELCGGKNAFAELKGLTPSVSLEALLQRQPQAILVSGMLAERTTRLAPWQQLTSLDAVRYKQVFYLNADWLHRATPRMTQGIAQLCEALDQVRRSDL